MADIIKTSTVRLVASNIVTVNPCWVYTLAGIGISASVNVFNVHDGFGTNDKIKMTLGGIQYQADFRPFCLPLFFAKGIYIDFTTNGTSFFVQFRDIAE